MIVSGHLEERTVSAASLISGHRRVRMQYAINHSGSARAPWSGGEQVGAREAGHHLRLTLADRSQLHLDDAVFRAPDEGLDLDELIEAQHLEALALDELHLHGH